MTHADLEAVNTAKDQNEVAPARATAPRSTTARCSVEAAAVLVPDDPREGLSVSSVDVTACSSRRDARLSSRMKPRYLGSALARLADGASGNGMRPYVS